MKKIRTGFRSGYPVSRIPFTPGSNKRVTHTISWGHSFGHQVSSQLGSLHLRPLQRHFHFFKSNSRFAPAQTHPVTSSSGSASMATNSRHSHKEKTHSVLPDCDSGRSISTKSANIYQIRSLHPETKSLGQGELQQWT